MAGQRQVEERWGVLFWNLIADFADQGLTRFDTARALGYHPHSFCDLLARHPSKDPFEPFIRATAYLRDTGETMGQALKRMAEEGRSWGYAARIIGYSDGHVLKRVAAARGIDVVMNSKHTGRPRLRAVAPKNDNLTVGWPSWDKVYEMGGARFSERKKKTNGSV